MDRIEVSTDTIAELITMARGDYRDGLEREAATWVAAVVIIMATTQATRDTVMEYLAQVIVTDQPASVDRIAAEHVMRLAAGE